MGNSTKNLLIGIFIIAACSLLVGIIMFLKPKVGDGKKTLYVRFSNINKINIGTRVTYAGRPVGEVVEIHEIANARKQPTDSIGRFYFYQLTLKVDSSVIVYNTDDIELQTSGLLGEKSVAIIPQRPPKGITPKLISNNPVYANSVDPIDNAFNELSKVANRMETTLDEVNKWIRENGDAMGCAVQSMGNVLRQIDQITSDINEQKLIMQVTETATHLNITVAKIQEIITQLEQDNAFTNLSTTIRNFKKASGSIDSITSDIADGKGTIGKLVKSDDLYLRAIAVMSKVDTLMNDINQYGMLFHLNKNWQRTHAQRVNLLSSLDTPQNFRTYFETEVDQVNTSMERISMMLQRAEQTCERENILQDEIFKKDFLELMRKVDDLADNLRLYNQQLMEMQETCN